MRPRETPSLERWREVSKTAVRASLESADLFTEFLVAGGPDAIKSLNQTVRKLQLQLKEHDADKRLERYRKLQKDLEECHKVRDSLRNALLSANWTEEEIDAHLRRALFKANTLYGASRELLLQENRILRSQLEDHLVTSRTSRPAGSPAPNRATVPGSKLKQAQMMQGPHMENVARLVEAAEALERAERGYKLPSVAHAEVQADDGSRRTIRTLEQQLATLAGQKLQLLQQVAAMTEQNRVLDMKLEGALDQVSELRRQKTEMLAHQDNLSADLREHLLSEAKRADTAEASLAESKLAAAGAKQAEQAARAQMERAMAEAQAMEAALKEKAEQVDTLRGLYLELREALERLAGDVTAGQQEAARRLLDATTAQLQDQMALLGDVKVAVDDTCRATQHHTDTVVELTHQQRSLTAEVARNAETATVTLGAYERQLGVTQQLLVQSEADRARLVRQALAASALARIEDQRHDKAVKRLLEEVPRSVAQQLGPRLEALEEGTLMVAEEVAKTKDTLVDAGITAGGAGARGPMLHAPMVPDEVDDATTRLLGDSKLLRAQLLGLSGGKHALAGGSPSPRTEPEPGGDSRGMFPGAVLRPPGLLATGPLSPGPLPPTPMPPTVLIPGPWPPGLAPPGPMPPHAEPLGRMPRGLGPNDTMLPSAMPSFGMVLERVWPHPIAPSAIAIQPGFTGPFPGSSYPGMHAGPVVLPGGPPGRMDLVLHLKPTGVLATQGQDGGGPPPQPPYPSAPPLPPTAPLLPQPPVPPPQLPPVEPNPPAPPTAVRTPSDDGGQGKPPVALDANDQFGASAAASAAVVTASHGGVAQAATDGVPVTSGSVANAQPAVATVTMSQGNALPTAGGDLPPGLGLTRWRPSPALIEAYRVKGIAVEGGEA